ncbi:MAG: hypothetical protein H0V54_13925 [Chthoniobacterales bacterium]|nr:hypothetical protein [Chthoniobacterales bacterium]
MIRGEAKERTARQPKFGAFYVAGALARVGDERTQVTLEMMLANDFAKQSGHATRDSLGSRLGLAGEQFCRAIAQSMAARPFRGSRRPESNVF